jgi:hypothetical protein
MVAVNPAVHHEVKLIHDPIFGWQLVGADSQLLREPLNVEDKTQPTLKFKTREGASTFAIKLMAKVKELVEKKEITLEDSDLPTDNNAIATDVKEEEVKENMLTKESYAAIKLLVKMDFTARGLTQFEVMALNSLRKYIENGIEPKLIKTFAEVLIKKLTPEERLILRDLSLKKVFKGRRLEDVREYFRGEP